MKDYLNINEAAKATNLSIPTIRAKLEKGLLPGASQIQEGKRKLWRIPFTDLLAAGLIDSVKANQESGFASFPEALQQDLNKLQAELEATKELLRRADQELESYRQRERYLFATLETRATQEARRSLWQRLTGK
jgi:DNA-binding transcriptional MerR regulator